MAEVGTIIGLVSAATALVASVSGPLVALHVGRTQVRAAVLSADRQRWIDGFRELVAEFCSQIAAAVQVRANLVRMGRSTCRRSRKACTSLSAWCSPLPRSGS